MKEFKKALSLSRLGLDELMLKNEEAITGKSRKQITKGLDRIIAAMEEAVKRGISTKGVLPGPIGLSRKAPGLYKKAQSHAHRLKHLPQRLPERFLVFINAYAMAASEENAAGKRVVTAPTSGSSGVMPSLIYLLKHHFKARQYLLRRGMLAASLIAFIVKHNASIAGAEVGCQGEIGVASSMAAAFLAHINGHGIEVIANAAEIALEHHLGMTCDPLKGYVQIPCIERNAVAAVEAYNAYLLASAGDPRKQKIAFDEVVEAMLETGRDMSIKYKETSAGGLAVCSAIC